jgi:predicted NBD/HSP70 family sugar kinase
MVEPHDEEQYGCGSYGCLEIMVSEHRALRLLEGKPGAEKILFNGLFYIGCYL